MRELKFRAWDKHENKMSPTNIGNMDDMINNFKWKYGNFWIDSDRFIYMQYTGLKDKNGKEIYEGDIIKSKWRCYLNIVEFNNGSFKLGYAILDDRECEDAEIIGNKFDNPDLNPKYVLTKYIYRLQRTGEKESQCPS